MQAKNLKPVQYRQRRVLLELRDLVGMKWHSEHECFHKVLVAVPGPCMNTNSLRAADRILVELLRKLLFTLGWDRFEAQGA